MHQPKSMVFHSILLSTTLLLFARQNMPFTIVGNTSYNQANGRVVCMNTIAYCLHTIFENRHSATKQPFTIRPSFIPVGLIRSTECRQLWKCKPGSYGCNKITTPVCSFNVSFPNEPVWTATPLAPWFHLFCKKTSQNNWYNNWCPFHHQIDSIKALKMLILANSHSAMQQSSHVTIIIFVY